MNCICGHVEEEHDSRSGSCTVKHCLCGGFDPEEEDD
jgi:hypothetical protein